MNLRSGIIFLLTTFCASQISLKAQKVPLTLHSLKAIHVKTEEVQFKGKAAIRLTGIEEGEQMAILPNIDFKSGTIEIEVAGQPLPGSDSSARGFIGVAFRVQQSDTLRYECFYLRPTNGRAEEQIRRNHSTQYISHPDYTWSKLRKENPGVYESYVDLIAGEWTRIKIVVKDKKASLFVNGADQPCLIVNDLKGGISSGAIALWIDLGTDGYFSDLKIDKQ